MSVVVGSGREMSIVVGSGREMSVVVGSSREMYGMRGRVSAVGSGREMYGIRGRVSVVASVSIPSNGSIEIYERKSMISIISLHTADRHSLRRDVHVHTSSTALQLLRRLALARRLGGRRHALVELDSRHLPSQPDISGGPILPHEMEACLPWRDAYVDLTERNGVGRVEGVCQLLTGGESDKNLQGRAVGIVQETGHATNVRPLSRVIMVVPLLQGHLQHVVLVKERGGRCRHADFNLVLVQESDLVVPFSSATQAANDDNLVSVVPLFLVVYVIQETEDQEVGEQFRLRNLGAVDRESS